MTSTALQPLWAKDLPLPVIAMAKQKAVEATAAWSDTVTGILAAALAVYEVHEAIGGKGGRGLNPGSFHAWAEEELRIGSSTFVATALAKIGSRHKELKSVYLSLPSSWGTLYELAKAPDDVFRRALQRIRPDMERNEVTCLLAEEIEQPPLKRVPQQQELLQPTTKTRARPSPSTPEPKQREAALTTIMAGSMWRTVKDCSDRVNTALMSGALSPEAKAFMVNNYLRPARDLIEALEKRLPES